MSRFKDEMAFLTCVTKMAMLSGWLVYHTHDSRRSQAGFPDLCLVKNGQIVFAELKMESKKPTPVQKEWLVALNATPARVYVWHPSDMPLIEDVIAGRFDEEDE